MSNFSVILFHSSNQAIWAAKVIKKNNFKCQMKPIPRNLSSDCGYCVEIKNSNSDRIKSILKAKGIEYDRIEEL